MSVKQYWWLCVDGPTSCRRITHKWKMMGIIHNTPKHQLSLRILKPNETNNIIQCGAVITRSIFSKIFARDMGCLFWIKPEFLHSFIMQYRTTFDCVITALDCNMFYFAVAQIWPLTIEITFFHLTFDNSGCSFLGDTKKNLLFDQPMPTDAATWRHQAIT